MARPTEEEVNAALDKISQSPELQEKLLEAQRIYRDMLVYGHAEVSEEMAEIFKKAGYKIVEKK